MLNTTNKDFFIIVFLLFAGCQSGQESKAGEETKPKLMEKEVAAKQDKSETSSLLNDLGLSFKEEKIIIDINKTSHFFETFEESVEEKITKIDLNISRDAGIIISEDEVSIDLNKTKNLLDDISGFFETVMGNINRSLY